MIKILKFIIYSLKRLLYNKVIRLKTKKKLKGEVLISYIINPFILKKGENIYVSHSNIWECKQIVNSFLDLGYNVDVINYTNNYFFPKKKYDYFIDIHKNLERLYPFLNKNCKKIFYLTGAHWLFQNSSEYQRLLSLQKRRGVTLVPRRVVEPSFGVELADYIIALGNKFTLDTFSYSKRIIFNLPISSQIVFEFPKNKNFDKCRNNFLWLGNMGMVHKGLDLLLETFSKLKDYNLYICGNISYEKDFEKEYRNELYNMKNIYTIGWINVSSREFIEILDKCVAIIYPSCSEGGGGSVITCMHGGLIPIVSYEASIDIGDFGFMLKECTIFEIERVIKTVSSIDTEELKIRSKKTWDFVNNNHTQEKFSESFYYFLENVLNIDI